MVDPLKVDRLISTVSIKVFLIINFISVLIIGFAIMSLLLSCYYWDW